MKGRILLVDGNEFWLSQGRHIFLSKDKGSSWSLVFSIPCSLLQRIILKLPLFSRLLRFGMHHFLKLEQFNAVCVFNKDILWLDLEKKIIVKKDAISGNRPLSFIQNDNKIIYGEYRSNPERGPVNVWCADIDNKMWSAVYTIQNIRHIHGIFFDGFTSTYWVTTGDSDLESKVISLSENFNFIRTVMQGSQQSRIVQPLFTKDYVYFASDAPDELNYIYHYVRDTGLAKRIQKLNAPVYYGRIIGDLILFSTVVEPSDINNQKTIDLWGYKLGEEWKCVKQFQKDSFSMKYFQYGQLLFPDYVNNSNNICFTESATTSHLKLHVYDAEDFFNL